jgi:hypothetical protein
MVEAWRLAIEVTFRRTKTSLTIPLVHELFAASFSAFLIGSEEDGRGSQEPGISQNGTASNRDNLPEAASTLPSPLLE